MRFFALDAQNEVIGAEDAAVAQAAGLSGGRELNEAGWECTGAVGVDGDGDALLAQDDVAVGCGNVPDAPGDAL